jgi:hypothetical protein
LSAAKSGRLSCIRYAHAGDFASPQGAIMLRP